MKGFKAFLIRGNVVDLAVAVVVGVAFTAVVTALVSDLITPLIAAIGGKPDFSSLAFKVNGSTFNYGDFVNKLITFVIIAAVVYFLVILPVGKVLAYTQRNKAATEQPCPECLSQIPIGAHRCKFCATVIATPGQASYAGAGDQR